jgi:hypothetical protein
MIQLQKRDYDILRLCYDQRFLVREHLSPFFGSHHSAPYRRLKELESAHLMKRDYFPSVGRNYIARLTRLGERKVEDRFGIEFPPMKAMNLNNLAHDNLVTSARLRLAQLWDASFVPERAIQAKEYPEIPDGIFFFQSGKGIALEVENSDKGRTRFINRLERWRSASSISFILYVTPHRHLFKILSRYLQAAPAEQPIGVVLWEDLLKGTPNVHTCLGEIDLFSRRSF